MKPLAIATILVSLNAFSQSLPNTGVGTAPLGSPNLGAGSSFPNSGVNDSNFTFNNQNFDPVTGQQLGPAEDSVTPNLNTTPTPIPQNQDLIFENNINRQAQEAEPSATSGGQSGGARSGQDTNISQ